MVSLNNIPLQTMNINNGLHRLESLEIESKETLDKGSSGDIKGACAEFESLLIYFMLKTMRDTIPKSGLLSGGAAEEVYTSMLDQQLAIKMADRGGLGLSSLLLSQLNEDGGILDKSNDEMRD